VLGESFSVGKEVILLVGQNPTEAEIKEIVKGLGAAAIDYERFKVTFFAVY
jgi:hypothetical protein